MCSVIINKRHKIRSDDAGANTPIHTYAIHTNTSPVQSSSGGACVCPLLLQLLVFSICCCCAPVYVCVCLWCARRVITKELKIQETGGSDDNDSRSSTSSSNNNNTQLLITLRMRIGPPPAQRQ
ncbi:uncharacterized protein LOC110183505 [Drosophila serrata]|uniref:uncharacterized protein LOC110183505 n=1 Tax=Drosophila serrata TaxID=7274 RepID=UPI000A1CFCD1|nr:uncharacterized protein LOC110183505 [Drosophila serrata]